MVSKGFTQQQMAEAVGCRQSFISGLITGKKTGIGADFLYRLCDALGVGCEHFKRYFDESEPEKRAKRANKEGKK
jgi:transcriptional regulator with XRE-family HTH domain